MQLCFLKTNQRLNKLHFESCSFVILLEEKPANLLLFYDCSLRKALDGRINASVRINKK